MTVRADVGVVAIGRNEGERLVRCLESLGAAGPRAIVYVDSGSTDGSVERAKERGAEVVSLDMSVPFTAARGRNAGFERLVELCPDLRYVQFVDGDCEMVEGWLEDAYTFLEGHPEFAVVCGRRRERHPDASLYNRLADMEWDTPIGEAEACGGDSMMRIEHFRGVGRFDVTLIAGEEPELCFRLREAGHKIMRLDRDMTLHDAAIFRFSQWWKRTVRCGHAYAESAYLHGDSPERFNVRQLRSAVVWGAVVPATAVGMAIPTLGLSLSLLGGYPVLWRRVEKHRRERGDELGPAALYATATVVGKFAELRGAAQFAWTRLVKKEASRIIEYKGPDAA